MKKFEGWEMRLAAYLRARQDMPFAWGSNDCASFCIGAIREMTGVTVYTVEWTTALQSERASEEAGGPLAAWTAALGRPGQNWAEARRGDVCMVELGGRQIVMICTGQTLCGPGPAGLEHLPVKEARHVFRVG